MNQKPCGPHELISCTRCMEEQLRVNREAAKDRELAARLETITLKDQEIHALNARVETAERDVNNVRNKPIPMRLACEGCGKLHIDEGEFATKPHHTHACQACGNVWRPAVVPTVGVMYLPGFKSTGPTGEGGR